MSLPSRLLVTLLSDATFGRLEAAAGSLDVDVEHDDTGLPFIPGKTVHGLLREAWLTMAEAFQDQHLATAARMLLGQEHTLMDGEAVLRVDNAVLPEQVRSWARYAVNRAEHQHPLHPELILRSVTSVRRQTAISHATGAPDQATLRSSRVIIRGVTFSSSLAWRVSETEALEQGLVECLALCALATRHGGLGRNRGRGFLQMTLSSQQAETGDWRETLAWAGLAAKEEE